MTYAVVRTDEGRVGHGRRDDHDLGRAVAWGYRREAVAEAAAEAHAASGGDYEVVDDYDRDEATGR